MQIVFLDTKTVGEVEALNKLRKSGNVRIYENTRPEEIIARCRGKEIIITNKVVIDNEHIDNLPDLRLICISATGMDNVNVEYAGSKGIRVTNVKGYSTDSVAQSTFSMLLYLLNRPAYYDAYVKSGAYSKNDIFTHIGPSFWELAGKRFGIIGLGNIGRKVAKIAESFGTEVVFYSTTGRNNNINYKRFDLDTLLATSDVVSVHAPLTDKTWNLITYEKLKLMRSCAIILNTGRGGIINEADLANALNDHVIAAAGIDVLSSEPIPRDHPLMKVIDKERILITPHVAWASRESRERLIERVVDHIEAYKQETGS